jgi:hypothetical protein
MSLRERVEEVLDRAPSADGVAVFSKELRLLAKRDPAPTGGCRIVVLDVLPPGFPDPPRRGARRGNWRVIGP